MILIPGLWVIVRSKVGHDYAVGKVMRVAGSLVYVWMDKERRIGRSRIMMSGDATSMREACQKLRSAAGEMEAGLAKARRTFQTRVDEITNPS